MGMSGLRSPTAFPPFTLRCLALGLLASALLIVFLFPNSHHVAGFAQIATVVGTGAAILCALTFWPGARVRMARFVNSRNFKFQYRVVRRNAAYVALAGLSFLLVRAAAGAITAEEFYHRAVASADKGDYDRAIQDYDADIKLNPKHAEAFHGRGLAYFDSGEDRGAVKGLDQAIQDYSQAIALNPQYADAYNDRGVAYADKGDFGRAIGDFDHAIALNPTNSTAFYDRGLAYQRTGNYDRGSADLDRAIELNPKFDEAFNSRGLGRACHGAYDRAIEDFDQAIRLNPKNVLAFLNRGDSYACNGEYDRAIQDYDQVLKLEPGNPEAIDQRKFASEHGKPRCPPSCE
jgi:tetratricopeptide (TPR) repeat protein